MADTQRIQSFRDVLTEFGPAVRRLCAGYERNEASRLDLEQDIFLNLWKALPRYRGDASLRTWVYRIAHNVASRHVRQAMRAPTSRGADERIDTRISDGARPDEAVSQADARSKLRVCIQQLRPLDRQIIMLFLEDIPQTEIGQITGLTQANISTRVHRIKGELTRMMST